MDIFKKLPERQVKLILILITLLIIVCSYFFGFQRFNSKANEIEKENKTLFDEKTELKKKNDNKEKVKADIIELNDKVELLIDEFPAGITQDKSIMFVNELMRYAGMKTSTIGLNDNTIFYTDTNNVVTDGTVDNLTTTESQQKSDKYNLTGYKSSINLTYQSTYAGLKKCIDYVNDNKERMNISELTASFDSSTGNLSGTMTINVYALLGTGKLFNDVDIRNIEIGTDNIFGTFEIPIDTQIDNSVDNIFNLEDTIENIETNNEAEVEEFE